MNFIIKALKMSDGCNHNMVILNSNPKYKNNLNPCKNKCMNIPQISNKSQHSEIHRKKTKIQRLTDNSNSRKIFI